MCVFLNPLKTHPLPVNPEPGMGPVSVSMGLGTSLSQPGLNQDCQQPAAGPIGCGDGLLLSVVTKRGPVKRKGLQLSSAPCLMTAP